VRVDNSPANSLREMDGLWEPPAQRAQSMIEERVFCLLNETQKITYSGDWNNPNWSKLWLYNLHYFDDLTAINSEQRSLWHHKLIQLWIDENPAVKGVGWEPYPSSLRITNWIKWALLGNKLGCSAIQSLTVQVRFLLKNIENHLLGNHLFANAKALLIAGLFFQGEEANSWYKAGHKILDKELFEQVLSDGGNFELSTMYHAIFLEDLLDLVNTHKAYEKKIPDGIEETIPKMLNWLIAMCHPDGEISFFNDSAIGNTPTVQRLLNYAKRLGFDYVKCSSGLLNFANSGYSRVSLGPAVAIIDRAPVGPDYLPGHAHADTLSFELSVFGSRVIVNSGTSVYGLGRERLRQRGTSAHSTVVIDNKNSSEVWSGFRVARRARVSQISTIEQSNGITLAASHDGYRRLNGSPIHNRKWIFSDCSLEIQDCITGKEFHTIEVVYPLHPDIEVVKINKDYVVLAVGEGRVKIYIEGEGALSGVDSTFHPEFGISVKSTKLVYHYTGQLPVQIITRVNW